MKNVGLNLQSKRLLNEVRCDIILILCLQPQNIKKIWKNLNQKVNNHKINFVVFFWKVNKVYNYFLKNQLNSNLKILTQLKLNSFTKHPKWTTVYCLPKQIDRPTWEKGSPIELNQVTLQVNELTLFTKKKKKVIFLIS